MKILLAILTSALLLTGGSTYASETCDQPVAKTLGTLMQAGISSFGESPTIYKYQGRGEVMARLYGDPEFASTDTIFIAVEPRAASNFIIGSKDDCTVVVGNISQKGTAKLLQFMDTVKEVNATQGSR